jgi:DNA-directed RNA polymerase II subunit RPB1
LLFFFRLKELVEYGPHPPPGKTGAKYIIREDGQRLDLRYLKKSSDQHLELGYKVGFHFAKYQFSCIFLSIDIGIEG